MKLPTLVLKHPVASCICFCMLLLLMAVFLHARWKRLPKGTSVMSPWVAVDEVRFLHDLTYRVEGERRVQQQIFDQIFRTIREAEEYVIVDMFLFNDEYHRDTVYPALAQSLTDTLIWKKTTCPAVKITVITDPINTFYGVYPSRMIDALEVNDIQVTQTRLEKLRHSNPIYSSFYAPFLSHFGTAGKGWISNPFSPDSPKVTLRGFLKMLNFRANHRKVVVTEKEAIVSSANPHDASFYHSNIAFSIRSSLTRFITNAELEVSRFSGGKPDMHDSGSTMSTDPENPADAVTARWVTEGKIRQQWLEVINQAQKGDQIQIAMFYFSERKLVRALSDAAERGVKIRLVLDPNKDAFGREKNGIPNRQVASELMQKKQDQLQIRWYHTEGEQFHSKIMAATLTSSGKFYAIGGSANLTRRNIADYNLEADLCIRIPIEAHHQFQKDVEAYFSRIWSNENGVFTDPYETYRDDTWSKKWMYRIQEATGACTF